MSQHQKMEIAGKLWWSPDSVEPAWKIGVLNHIYHQATIIRFGAVAQNGEEFYRELNDYDDRQVRAEVFLKNQVMPQLRWAIDANEWKNSISRDALRDN